MTVSTYIEYFARGEKIVLVQGLNVYISDDYIPERFQACRIKNISTIYDESLPCGFLTILFLYTA